MAPRIDQGRFDMEHAYTLITFEEDGHSVLLHDDAQCAAAVAGGRLSVDTQVIVYDEGRSVVMRAAAFPPLARMFAPEPATALAAAADPQPDPVNRATSADAVPADAPDEDVAPALAPQPVRAPPPPLASPTAPPPPPQRPRAERSSAGRNAIIALGAFFAVAYCASRLPMPVAVTPTPTLAPTETPSPDATPTADPDADLLVQTFYAVRSVHLQPRAAAGSDWIARRRGDVFTGVVVDGVTDATAKWLKIKSGNDTGRFISMVNLSVDAPPGIDESFSGEQVVQREENLRTGPDDTADLVANRPTLTAGMTVTVAGIVNTDWAEITLSRGGVGYVRREAFTASEPVDAPTPDAAPTPGATPASGPAPPSRTGGHQILVTNRCSSHSFEVAIYYRSAQGWQSNGGSTWTYRAGQSAYPTLRQVRLTTVDDRIYYAIPSVDGSSQAFRGSTPVDYGVQRLLMNRVKVSYAANGDYEIALDC